MHVALAHVVVEPTSDRSVTSAAAWETGWMRPLGVHHVSINVADTSAAIDFYTNVLGLVQRTDRPDFPFAGAWLDLGDQQVHLLEIEVPTQTGQHFAMWVADLDGVVAEVRSHGVTVSEPRRVGPGRQAFLHDPSGNLVELNEPGA
jgi:catechol 2,3-dioxygenase-like lactoylglutathione lyase family enzyme